MTWDQVDHDPRHPTFRALAALAWTILALVGLLAMGHGTLQPESTEPGALIAWLRASDGIIVAFAVLRLALCACALYLALALLVVAIAMTSRRPGHFRLLHRFTTPGLRHLMQAVCGLSMATVLTAAPLTMPAGADPIHATSAHATQPDVTEHRRVAVATSTATLAPTGAIPADATSTPDAEVTASGAEPFGVPKRTWSVRPGDHLWSISERTLSDALGRGASDAEVTPYWLEVVRSNPQFRDPDLIHPGEIVRLPPIQGGGTATLRPM